MSDNYEDNLLARVVNETDENTLEHWLRQMTHKERAILAFHMACVEIFIAEAEEKENSFPRLVT